MLECTFERTFEGHISLITSEIAHSVGQSSGQDSPQPCSQLGVGASAELIQALVCLQESLLDQVRWIELSLKSGRKLHPRKQAQIFPVSFQLDLHRLGLACAP